MVGLIVLMFVLVWFFDEKKVAEMVIPDTGAGKVTYGKVTLQIEQSEKRAGSLELLESIASLESGLKPDYETSIFYKIQGGADLFTGDLTVKFPVPADLLGKYPMEELKTGTLIVVEEPASSRMSDLSSQKYLLETTFDEQDTSLTAVLSFDKNPLAEGLTLMNDRPQNFSLFPAAYAGNEYLDRLKDRGYWVAFGIQYYAGTLKKKETDNFVCHYMMGLNGVMIGEFLDEMEAHLDKIESLGFSSKGLVKKIPVDLLLLNGRYGEMAKSNQRGKGTLRIKRDVFDQNKATPTEWQNIVVTGGHELLHLVQEYYIKGNTTSNSDDYIWLDEGFAIWIEPLLLGDADFVPQHMTAFTPHFFNKSLLHTNSFLGRSDLGNFGYGMSYFWLYAIKQHPRKRLVISDIYRDIESNKAQNAAQAVAMNFTGNHSLDKLWTRFLDTYLTAPGQIHNKLSMNKDANTFNAKAKSTDEPVLVFKAKESATDEFVKEYQDNQIVLKASLRNLSSEIFMIQMMRNDPATKKLLQTLGRTLTISVKGDMNMHAMVYLAPTPNSVTPVSGTPDNTIGNGGQVILQDFNRIYVIVQNNDPDPNTLTKRNIEVTLQFNSGETMADITPPPAEPELVDEKIMKELQRWRDHCERMGKPNQQSNDYLVDYFVFKTEEYKTAIELAKTGTHIYGELSLTIPPEKPEDLIKDLDAGIRKITKLQNHAFNAKLKMEEILNSGNIEGDPAEYERSIAFFDNRRLAYGHLMDYLEAVEEATKSPSKPDNRIAQFAGKYADYDGSYVVISPDGQNMEGTVNLKCADNNLKPLKFKARMDNLEFDDEVFNNGYRTVRWECKASGIRGGLMLASIEYNIEKGKVFMHLSATIDTGVGTYTQCSATLQP